MIALLAILRLLNLLLWSGLLVGGVIVALIRVRPALKKVAADREANLLEERADEMKTMRDRIDRLEKMLRETEAAHVKERETERAQFSARLAHYRHRTNNLDQSFNALLMLLKKGVPVEDAVAEVEALRQSQLEREAAEAATLHAAGVTLQQGPSVAND